MDAYLAQGLELGRSFVQPRYWGKRSLDYLWYGIGAYLQQNPQIRYLFGGVSLPTATPKQPVDLLVYFYTLYFSEENDTAIPNLPYQLPFDTLQQLQQHFSGQDYSADFTQLKHLLAHMGLSIPTLYKQYGEVAEPGGVQFLAFGIRSGFCRLC